MLKKLTEKHINEKQGFPNVTELPPNHKFDASYHNGMHLIRI